MAAFVRSAPLPQLTGDNFGSVVDKEFYKHVENSQNMIMTILVHIPETHTACIPSTETMVLDKDKGKFAVVAKNIGIPVFPILDVSPDITWETSFVQMCKGILLHQTLLSDISTHLGPQETVTGLLADIKDLLFQLHKLLKKIQGDSAEQPAAPVLDLQLSGEFDIQAATHVTLQQLQDFSQDMQRILRRVAEANEDVTEAPEQ